MCPEDAAVPFFWRLALHFLIAPQFGGCDGPASLSNGPASGDEADGPASDLQYPASEPSKPAWGVDGPASGSDGPASEQVAAGLKEKAHEWVRAPALFCCIFVSAALEATKRQMDGFFSQLPYKCYLDEVASVGD